jgi:hypothetical protein
MKKYLFIFMATCLLAVTYLPTKAATPRDYYWIKVYHCSSAEQLNHIDQYLENTYLPFLHQSGIKKVGVFAPIGNDTSSDKRIFVWIPLKSLQQLDQLDASIEKIDPMGEDALIHLDNKDSSLPYNRIESILTKAFKMQPQYETKSDLVKSADKIFEYRSYESATEDMHLRKVHMFNEGGEIALFKRLNFNAIFYSKAITGARTPNLIYMTSFNNMADRDAHWKTFQSDPEWKKLSATPVYLKTVSKNETILMKAKAYGDF